jgi:cystathionine beta-lyase
MGDLCLKHNVIVLSDEIHADLVLQDNKHVPFASLGEAYAMNSITYSSPSKAFNLAGLQVGYFFTKNEKLKKSVNDILHKQEMIILNSFAVDGLIAAYEKGEPWLDAVKEYIYNNYLHLCEFGKTHFPSLKVSPLQATYLVWIDCSALNVSSKVFADWLMNKEGLWINRGSMFGEAGEYFLRINIACPKPLLTQGLQRLAKGYQHFIDQSV